MTGAILKNQLECETDEIKRLFEGLAVIGGFDEVDLRETAKFAEEINVHGLPVHPIAHPIGAEAIRVFAGTLEQLPGAAPDGGGGFAALRGLLDLEPTLLVRGALGGGCGRPFVVSVFIPQSQAHVAHAIAAMLWPVPEGRGGPSDLNLIQIPESAQRFIVHIPQSHTVFIAGIDDPRAGLVVAIEEAHRKWRAVSPQLHEQEEGCGGDDDHDHDHDHGEDGGEGAGAGHEHHHAAPAAEIPAMPEDGLEPVALLPGGCFLLNDATLIFSGESIPDGWEAKLIGQLPSMAGLSPADVTLAQAEPWVAEGGGRVSPLWRNPPLPARMMAAQAGWAEAALHWGAIPCGVHVDEAGRIDLAQSEGDAFVIVPRAAIPAPFSSVAGAVKTKKLITHHYAKNDGMRLWAALFPMPVVV